MKKTNPTKPQAKTRKLSTGALTLVKGGLLSKSSSLFTGTLSDTWTRTGYGADPLKGPRDCD